MFGGLIDFVHQNVFFLISSSVWVRFCSSKAPLRLLERARAGLAHSRKRHSLDQFRSQSPAGVVFSKLTSFAIWANEAPKRPEASGSGRFFETGTQSAKKRQILRELEPLDASDTFLVCRLDFDREIFGHKMCIIARASQENSS